MKKQNQPKKKQKTQSRKVKKPKKKKKKTAIRMKIPNLLNDQNKQKKQQPPVRKSKPNFKGAVAQRLQRVADWEGVSIECAMTSTNILKIAGLTKKQITKKVIREANRIDRRETEDLKTKVWKLDGAWNRERSPMEEARIKKEKEEEREKRSPRSKSETKREKAYLPNDDSILKAIQENNEPNTSALLKILNTKLRAGISKRLIELSRNEKIKNKGTTHRPKWVVISEKKTKKKKKGNKKRT